MSNIAQRLRASVGLNAINGDSFERSVCTKQMMEAARTIEKLEAKLVVRELTADLMLEAILPKWKDPYTNNGDSRADTNYRHGWNDCRAAVLAALAKEGMS